MTKIGEKKFTYSDVPKFYSIPVACCDEHCYLNVGKNSITKIHDQKPLHTWTLTHPNFFTSPVVYCNSNLYCVMNSTVLMKWSVNDDNLKNAEKIKFQEPIFTVIAVPDKQPIVLLKSGRYATVDGPQPCETTASASGKTEVVWADVSTSASGQTKLFFVSSSDQTAYSLHCHNLDCEENYQLKLTPPASTSENPELKAWCLNKFNSLFLSVWADGVVCLLKENNPKWVNVMQLKESQSIIAVAASFIGPAHVGIAYSTNHKEIVLEIWDVNFCILKARKLVPASNIQDLQISSEEPLIFLCCSKELMSYTVNIEPSTLAAAMGKFQSEGMHTLEFCWNEHGELTENPASLKPEAMDVAETNGKSPESIEDIARKLLSENSQYLSYIPESELAKILYLAISHYRSKQDEKIEDPVANILNIVFSASFNDMYLIKYLKRMNLEDTLVTLELLSSYLDQKIGASEKITTQKPSGSQIINWTFLLIQSHMEALLLSKDKKTWKILRKFETSLSLEEEEYKDYESIRNYFLILKKNTSLPEQVSSGKYFVENLYV